MKRKDISHCPQCKLKIGNVSVPSRVEKGVRFCSSYCRALIEGGVIRAFGRTKRRFAL